MKKKTKIAIIGFGQRGCGYASIIKDHELVELTAICEKNSSRASSFAKKLGVENVPCFTSFEEMLANADFDAAIITTPDFDHRDTAVACCQAGKHIMLEKPMAPTAEECREIIRTALEYNCMIQIGFVLRCHPVFRRVIEIARSGSLGQIMNITSTEHIGVMHGASYMRRWHRKSVNSGGFLLAKCSHDLDIIATVANSHVRRVASFGSLEYFTSDKLKYNYCSQCDDRQCRYRFGGDYVRMNEEENAKPSDFNFDLCVYNKDKDVVDHQVAILEFANGIKANFALNLFAEVPKRTICVAGTEGILYADTSEHCINIHYSNGKESENIPCLQENQSAHGGSDLSFLNDFVKTIESGCPPKAGYAAGLASTVVGNAIEKSRLAGEVVTIPDDAYSF